MDDFTPSPDEVHVLDSDSGGNSPVEVLQCRPTQPYCPISSNAIDSTFDTANMNLLPSPMKRSSTIIQLLDLDDLSSIDLTGSSVHITSEVPKKRARRVKRVSYSPMGGINTTAPASVDASSSAGTLSTTRFVISDLVVPTSLKRKRMQSKLRLQRFRLRKRIIAVKRKHDLAKESLIYNATKESQKQYSLRKTSFVTRVGFCPSASAARVPLASIIRFISDQELSKPTVEEYRTRFRLVTHFHRHYES